MEQVIFTTLCMIYDDQDRVLVQKRSGTAWDGIAFPGGHVEPGESFTESAIREVFEETGYCIEKLTLCGIKHFQTDSGIRYVILLYKTHTFSGTLCSSGEGDVFWIKRSEWNSYPLARDMTAMLELFDNDEKSEFYYLSSHAGDEYLII